jgi:hypothetical protein
MEVNVGGMRRCDADFEEAFFEERLKIFEGEWL